MRQKLPKQAEVQLLVNEVMARAEAELRKDGKCSAAAAWLVPGALKPEFRTIKHSAEAPTLSIQ
jgi:hypothetical protein